MKPTLPALALVLLLPAAASARNGVDALNEEIQQVYTGMRPKLEALIRQEAQANIGALKVDEPKLKVRVTRLGAITLDIGTAPGLTSVYGDQLSVRVPREGCWQVEVEADVEVRAKYLWKWRTHHVPLRVIVKKLSLEAGAEIDHGDPTHPTLRRVEEPEVSFKLKLRSSKFFQGILLRAASPFASLFAKKALAKVMSQMAGTLTVNLQGIPKDLPGDSATLLTDATQLPVPFEELTRNIQAKVSAHHRPYGYLVPVDCDKRVDTTWIEAYRDGGPGIQTAASELHGDGGDSATFTGIYLASQAFRYAVSGGDPAALAEATDTLDAVEFLFAVYDDRGLIARTAAPLSSKLGQTVASWNHPSVVIKQRNGQPWIAFTAGGPGGVSRDVYAMTLFGLAVTRDLVPALRGRCDRLIQLALDYLIQNDWQIDEDRPAFDLKTGKNAPTFWLGIPTQKLTFLLMGQRVRAGKYAAELDRWGPLAETAWVSTWTGQFDLHGYFGKNLAHKTFFNYFRLETDPTRWRQMARAFAILHRFVAKHIQPPFHLVDVSVNPGERATWAPVIREGLRQFLRRPHRNVEPAGYDVTAIPMKQYDWPLADPLGQLNRPSTVTLAAAALPVELRDYSGNYIWQRNPFRPMPGGGAGERPLHESPGLDLLLPYYLGRYLGVTLNQ